MTPRELKNSILQLAIQGKLVEQRQEEGTAEELYKQIQAEKQTLIKAGKIKKEKPLPEISEDEIPFEIPDSWMWVHPTEIASVVVGATPSTSVYEYWNGGSIPWLPSGCCQDCLVTESNPSIKYISSDAYDSCSTKLMPINTVMIALTGATAGKVGLLSFEACGNQSIVGISPLKGVLPTYLFFHLMARRSEILSDCIGSAQPHISKDYITKMFISFPPLAEQKRIVAKIEELLPLIDRYEAAWSRLEDFNKRFPEDMQRSIHQLAIQGKLVEQRPEEGTGEELYRRIQAEKQALIKAGKIKKEKPLPEIAEDEIPFEIPESWKWVRWGDLSESIQYGYNAPAQESGRIKMVRISDIQDGRVLWDFVPYCEISEKDIPTYLLSANDILFARTGGTVGKSYLVKDVPEESIYAGYLIRTRYSAHLCPEYMKYFMESQLYWDQLHNGTIATAQPNCNGKTLSRMILPLPPLAEQKRIVAQLEELLPLCERMK